MENDLGNLVYESMPKKSASIKKRLKTTVIVMVLLMVFGAFIIFALPQKTLTATVLGIGLIVLGLIIFILSFVIPTSSNEIGIYKNGLKNGLPWKPKSRNKILIKDSKLQLQIFRNQRKPSFRTDFTTPQ